jgi:hypothetical protein
LKEKNITIAKSDAWHKDLLKISFENNIISEELKILFSRNGTPSDSDRGYQA